MIAGRSLMVALSVLAVAAPAVAQRGQYDDRPGRSDRYDRDDRDRGGYDRGRDDRDRRGNDRRDDDRRDRFDPLPGGSWAQSCRRAEMSGRSLAAECKDQRGKWRATRISPRQCPTGRVGNRFGTLVCE